MNSVNISLHLLLGFEVECMAVIGDAARIDALTLGPLEKYWCWVDNIAMVVTADGRRHFLCR